MRGRMIRAVLAIAAAALTLLLAGAPHASADDGSSWYSGDKVNSVEDKLD